MSNNSPFSDFFGNLGSNTRAFFSKHDPYLNFAFILSILPIPFTGIISLIIVIIGVIFLAQNKFKSVDESKYLLAIFFMSILNMIFVYWFYSFAAKTYLSFIFEFYFSFIDFIKNFFTYANPYIKIIANF